MVNAGREGSCSCLTHNIVEPAAPLKRSDLLFIPYNNASFLEPPVGFEFATYLPRTFLSRREEANVVIRQAQSSLTTLGF